MSFKSFDLSIACLFVFGFHSRVIAGTDIVSYRNNIEIEYTLWICEIYLGHCPHVKPFHQKGSKP